MTTLTYDNPNDIESVELTIQTVSGHSSTVIYANGRNQLPVEIIAKATKKNDDDDDVVLNFSDEIWIHILNLRLAESDEKLNWHGNSGWCFTATENDFSREVQTGAVEGVSPSKHAVLSDGSKQIIMYVYTKNNESKRIAVSIDTDNGKHFTTADASSGAEKMSVSVSTLFSRDYTTSDITTSSDDLGKGKAVYSKDSYIYLTTHQKNFYFSLTGNYNYIYKYEYSSYAGNDNQNQLSKYWSFWEFSRGLYVGYAWPQNMNSPHSVNLYDPKNDTFSESISVSRQNTAVFTVLEYTANETVDYISDVFKQSGNSSTWGTTLKIYDQFGESGHFKIGYGDSSVWLENI
jgi:hypothetical protein